MTGTALVIIDVQRGLLAQPELVHDPDGVLNRINAMVTCARQQKTPVIFVQHEGSGEEHPLRKTSDGWAIHDGTGYVAGDIVIEKRECDAFQNTDLQARLDAMGVEKLVVAGMCSEYCIDTTVRRAYSLGYQIILASDAHTTISKDHMPAELIVRHHNAILGSGFAAARLSADIDFKPAEVSA